MPWNWKSRGNSTGGDVGGLQDSKRTHAWPNYESDYLRQRLANPGGKYSIDGIPGQLQGAFISKVADDYKYEADEQLRREFDLWLQGLHPNNDASIVYDNSRPGAPRRRQVHERDGIPVGAPLQDWRPTPWGNMQLTHLPGVREYLRGHAIESQRKELDLNLLAEYGPQDIEQAWLYFKHWVKGRELSQLEDKAEVPPDGFVRSAPRGFGREYDVYGRSVPDVDDFKSDPDLGVGRTVPYADDFKLDSDEDDEKQDPNFVTPARPVTRPTPVDSNPPPQTAAQRRNARLRAQTRNLRAFAERASLTDTPLRALDFDQISTRRTRSQTANISYIGQTRIVNPPQ